MRSTKRTDAPLAKGPNCAWSGISDEEKFYRSEEVPFRLTWLVLGSMGVVPCIWKRPYSPSLHPTKSTFVVGFAILGVMLKCLYHSVSCYMQIIFREETPLYMKITIPVYFTFSLYAAAVVSTWFDVPAIQRALKTWMRLSKLYLQLTKRRPKMRWQLGEKIAIAVVSVFPFVGLSILKDIHPEFRFTYYAHILPLAYLAMIVRVFLLSTLWVGYCSYIAEYAKEVNQEIAKSVQQNSLTSEKLRLYRDIWIQMKAFADTLSTLNTYFILLIPTLPSLIIGAFLFMLHHQAGMNASAFALFFYCVYIVIFIGCYGASTDRLVYQIKSLYTAIFALQNFSPMKTGAQFQIINMYLMENLRPINPTFSGFLSVTKAVIPSILSFVTINVVILAQVLQPQTSQ